MSLIVKAINLSIFSTTEDDSLIVRVAVENEGCSPLKQVRITVNSTSYTGRPNATFRIVGLARGVLYPLKIETEAESEEFVQYKVTAFRVWRMPIQKSMLFDPLESFHGHCGTLLYSIHRNMHLRKNMNWTRHGMVGPGTVCKFLHPVLACGMLEFAHCTRSIQPNSV